MQRIYIGCVSLLFLNVLWWATLGPFVIPKDSGVLWGVVGMIVIPVVIVVLMLTVRACEIVLTRIGRR